MTDQSTVSGSCPHCRTPVDYEPCALLPKVVPLCDPCGERQAETFAAEQRAASWRRYFAGKLPRGYQIARLDRIAPVFAEAISWSSSENPTGIGLIGESGTGKTCTIAALLRVLERPFLWWSGTEARDAAIDAATADKDREGCRRRWEQGMTIPILVLDDISQGKMTEAWSAKLFDLLETRTASALPTFWTSQIDLPDLRAKIGRQNGGDDAQADAISRRLSQHSLILGASRT